MSKIENEKRIVELMIRLYCNKKHRGKVVCSQCEALKDYSLQRLDRCSFGEMKPACVDCEVHCYRSDMRDRIRSVMRFAGSRMLFYHPLDFFRHLQKK